MPTERALSISALALAACLGGCGGNGEAAKDAAGDAATGGGGTGGGGGSSDAGLGTGDAGTGGAGTGGAGTGDAGTGGAGGVSVRNAAASAPRCPVGSRTAGGGQLVPVDGTLHGAGQSPSDFAAYYAVMPAANKPAVYMTYVSLKETFGQSHADWAASVAADLARYPEFLSLQVGLSMTTDPDPSGHYEADVASGKLDDQLNRFIDALEWLARPVYLRIGYEFNGTAWNGYLPEPYKDAFKTIANRVRARGLEVALVWDAVTGGGDPNFMAYYPGDAFVDWWALNLFSQYDFASTFAASFLDAAAQAVPPKPVLIGESTPMMVGVLGGQPSWDAWFRPYFNLIHQRSSIRMFSYINTDWTTNPGLSTWGDARIQANPTVSQNYVTEMQSSIYRHGTSESAQRSRFGLSDTTAPAAVQGLLASEDAPQLLQWSCLDNPGLAAYLVDRDGARVARTLNGGYVDGSLRAGQSTTFSVRAIDRAGNLGPPTTVQYQMPRSFQRAINGGFDADLTGWSLSAIETAAGTLSREVDGANGAAHVVVTTPTGTDYHLQLVQPLQLNSGVSYALSFRARSSAPNSISAALQQQGDPYAVYGNSGTLALSTTWKSFTFTVARAADQRSEIKFMLAAVTAGAWVEIDDVRLVESAP